MIEIKDKFRFVSKIVGMIFFFVGISLLMSVFFMAMDMYNSPEGMIPEITSEEFETAGIDFLQAILIFTVRYSALFLMAVVGSWICTKSVSLIREPKITMKEEKM